MHHKKPLDFPLVRYKAVEQGGQPGALTPLANQGNIRFREENRNFKIFEG